MHLSFHSALRSSSFRLAAGLWLLIAVTSLTGQRIGSGRVNVITWDVYGYYLYLPAIFIYNDVVRYDFTADHFSEYAISGNFYQLNERENGMKAPIYTMGMALLYSPFFGVAHAYARWSDRFPADGLSQPYQIAIIAGALVYIWLGLWLLQRVLRRYFSEEATMAVLFAIVLGTNYFHYAAFEPGMPHHFSFTLYAAILYFIVRWHDRPGFANSLMLGLLFGLNCLARPSEVVGALLFLGYGLGAGFTPGGKLKFLLRQRRRIGLILLAGLLTISPQLLFWKMTLGEWIYNGYEGHHFDFLQPHLYEGLFSYRKGWLLYTPLMALAVAGLPLLFVRLPQWSWAILSFFLLNLYVVFSWHIWWYASSFGSRPVVQSYAVLALPLGVFVATLRRSPWTRYGLFLVIALGVLLNQFQNWQYRQRILPFDENSKTYYWKVFGRTELPDPHIRKYLDLDEQPPSEDYTLSPFPGGLQGAPGRRLPQTDTLPPEREFGPTLRHAFSAAEAAALSGQWIQVATTVKALGDDFDKWKTAYLTLTVDRNGKNRKWVGVRFQHFIETGQWERVTIESQLPELQAGDEIKAFIWNQSPDTLLVREMQWRRMAF